MTVRTQTHHATTGAIIPSVGIEANFSELYDLQDGGIDSTNMDMTAVYAWSGAHSFSADVNFDSGTLYIDSTNNRVYIGSTSSYSVDSLTYQHQITVLAGATLAQSIKNTATGATGVREARYHDSVSPADNDLIYTLKVYGNNDAAAIKEYGRITVSAEDVTAGTEDSQLYIDVMKAGTLTTTLMVDRDQVQVRPESLVVGGTTNVGPDGFNVGLYTKLSDSNRRVACFSSTDSTASSAVFDIYKNSASPASSDAVATIRFMGNDSGGNYQIYAGFQTNIIDATSGSEDGKLLIYTTIAGASTNIATFSGTANGGIVFSELTTINDQLFVVHTGTTSNAVDFTANSLTTGSALEISSSSTSTSNRDIVSISQSSSLATSAVVIRVTQASSATCAIFSQSGNGNCVSISHTGDAGYGLTVNLSTGSSGSSLGGIYVDGSNAGAGNFIGVDFSGMTSGDPLIKINANEGILTTSTTNSTGSFYIEDAGGTLRQVPYF